MPRFSNIIARIREGLTLLRNAILSARTNPALPAVIRGMGGRKTLFLLITGMILYLLLLYEPHLNLYKRYMSGLRINLAIFHPVPWQIVRTTFYLLMVQPVSLTFVLPLSLGIICRRFLRSNFFRNELRTAPLDAHGISCTVISVLLLSIAMAAAGKLLITFILNPDYFHRTLISSIYFESSSYRGPKSWNITLALVLLDAKDQILWLLKLFSDAIVTFFIFVALNRKRSIITGLIAWKTLSELISILSYYSFVYIFRIFRSSNVSLDDQILQPEFIFLYFSEIIVIIHILIALYCLSLLHRHIEKQWYG